MNTLFRKLSSKEEEAFRQWAREHYIVGTPINEVWHPVTRAECEAMNLEENRK